MWWKYMINVGVNQVSAVLRAVRHLPEISGGQGPDAGGHAGGDRCGRRQREPTGCRRYSVLDSGHGYPGSKGQDLHLPGRPGRTEKTEVEMFAGILLAMGRDLNIPTPLNRYLFNFLKAIEQDMGADDK